MIMEPFEYFQQEDAYVFIQFCQLAKDFFSQSSTDHLERDRTARFGGLAHQVLGWDNQDFPVGDKIKGAGIK